MAKYKAAESRRVERIRNGRVKALGVSELNRYKEDAARRQRECRQRRKAARLVWLSLLCPSRMRNI